MNTIELLKEPVLVVDDDEDVLATHKRLLESIGAEVVTANSGDAAVKVIVERRPFLVITDYLMTGMTGIDLCRVVKADHPDIAVVIVTGVGEKDIAIQSIRAHCDDFIEKPLDREAMTAIVQRFAVQRLSSFQEQSLNGRIVQLICRQLGILPDEPKAHLAKMAPVDRLKALVSLLQLLETKVLKLDAAQARRLSKVANGSDDDDV